MNTKPVTARPILRCAIYTRKSTEDGLDQAFNSLDAQFEACAAYIASQRHEGWKRVPERYDDGGLSGGTLERPALQRLLADIASGRVGMIVVYKIDRLTRSLADFARLVERFEAAGASFVSVTQAFNTSTSMGRLTLNVLLSFAQFEREVTAERIRDKIAASKKKGLWMGGRVPLGYDRGTDPRQPGLVVNPAEAETVRSLFALYDRLGCLRRLEDEADRLGLRSKERRAPDGRTTGGARLTRGMLHHLLTNPVYRGLIRHHDRTWPGQHAAIVPEDLWTRVQSRLVAQSARERGKSGSEEAMASPLTGRIEDASGDRLTPSHAQRHGRRYRYYVSSRLLQGTSDPTGWRLPAPAFEAAIADLAARHLEAAASGHRLLLQPEANTLAALARAAVGILEDLRAGLTEPLAQLVDRVILGEGRIEIRLSASALAGRLGVGPAALDPALLTITAPFALRRRGVEAKIVAGTAAPQADPHLRQVLLAAHRWLKALKAGRSIAEIARDAAHSENYIRARLPLALLSPRLQAAILDGSIGPGQTVESLLRADLPTDWTAQEQRLGYPSN